MLGEQLAEPAKLDLVADRATAALCADSLGVMQAAWTLTRDYLRTRRQFGAPLSSFQALQHRFMDMTMELEQARSMTLIAAMACDAPDAVRRRRLVAAGRLRVGKAGRFIGEQAIQMHGGIGMTEEHRIGRLYKRILLTDTLLGSRSACLDRLNALASLEFSA